MTVLVVIARVLRSNACRGQTPVIAAFSRTLETMSVIYTVILHLQRLTAFLARKLLHLILPYSLSLFPTPSNHLANFVGIDPIAIKSKPLPIPSLVKYFSNLLPGLYVIDLFNLVEKQRDPDPSSTSSSWPDPTSHALGDGIYPRSPQNKLASPFPGERLGYSGKPVEMADRKSTVSTTQLAPPKAEQGADESPIEGMNRIVAEGLDNLGRVSPLPLSTNSLPVNALFLC